MNNLIRFLSFADCSFGEFKSNGKWNGTYITPVSQYEHSNSFLL